MGFLSFQTKQKYFIASLIISLLCITFFCGKAHAQLDQTFGSGGKVISNLLGEDAASNIFYLPDGKLLVFGKGTTTAQDATKYYFARYNSNGTLDSAYGTNGIVILNNIPVITTGTESPGISRQADGKFIIVGSDQGAGYVARVNEDGTLDTTFAGTGIHRPNLSTDMEDFVCNVVIQPDGKILVSGITATGVNYAAYREWLMRYNTDGTLDSSFAQGVFLSNYYEGYSYNRRGHLLVQSNGKILYTNRSLSWALRMYRLNSNGTYDNTFSILEFYATYAVPLSSVILQPDDKILILDYSSEGTFNDTNVRLRRYTSNGQIDMGFGNGGTVLTDISFNSYEYPAAMTLQQDGKILIAGNTEILWGSYFSGSRFMLARYNPNGSLDGKMLTEFIKNDFAKSMVVQPDGKIVLAGNIVANQYPPYLSDMALARYTNVSMETYRYRGVLYNFNAGYPTNSTYQPRACISIYRPGVGNNDSRWYSPCDGNAVFVGGAGDIPVAADYSGDFRADYAAYRPSTSTWYFYGGASITWGQPGDIPVPGYYDADTKADLAVFRPSTGTWFIRRSSDLSSYSVQWGLNGDKPVVGDYDGDGLDDIAVWRPSDSVWYILNSSNNQPAFIQWGLSGDKPVQADYDGDGKTDAAIWRPSEGNWYILNSSNFSYTGAHWGISSDIPTPADYDGDRKADIAVWRPGDTNWYILQSGNSTPFIYNYGISTDIPVPGK